MIVSITFRHGTESKDLRHHVWSELMSFSKYTAAITRIQVVFSLEAHHNNSENLVTCHLSIAVPNKQQINIFEQQANGGLAFDLAQERAISRLVRICSCNERSSAQSVLGITS